MQIKIRTLQEVEIPEAKKIFKLAFGTFLGLPNPLEFLGQNLQVLQCVNQTWKITIEQIFWF